MASTPSIRPSPRPSTLSTRGAEWAVRNSLRDHAGTILAEPWDPMTNPEGIVNLGTAENHLMLDDVAEFIRGKDLKLQGRDFDYGEGPWGSVRLRKGMAKFINRYFHPYNPIDPDNLTFANGCVSLFNMLGLILGDPGDGILLSMPSYIALPSDFGILAKLNPIYVPFHSTSQFAPSCITAYEAAYDVATRSGTRICALLLCNPHNPLGQCYPAETLIALMRFCNARDIHLIADEIYAQSVYTVFPHPEPASLDSSTHLTPTPFTSILSLTTADYIRPAYLCHLYGLSKDFACGGLRLGVLYTQNRELFRAISAMNQFHWPGSIDCIVAATMLEDSVWLDKFLEISRRRLGESSELARGMLRGLGVEWKAGSSAGFFLWVDLRAWLGGDGWEMEERLTEILVENKVFLTGGRRQGSEEPGWYRLVFAREKEVLREGFRRLGRALREVKGKLVEAGD